MRAFAIRSCIKPPHLGLASQFVIVLLVIALMGAMAIEPGRQLLEQRERVAGMKEELEEVLDSNADLRHRIKRLGDPDFIEQRAREQIGLVREGEITYQVMPPTRRRDNEKKSKQKSKRKRNRSADRAGTVRPSQDDEGFFETMVDFIGL